MTNLIENYIGVFDNIISKQDCKGAMSFLDNKISLDQTYTRLMAEGVSENIKKDTSYFLEQTTVEEWEEALKKIFNGVGIAWNSYKSITGIADYYKEAQFSFETTKLQKTKPTEGYHVWHIEHDEKRFKRILFFITYLNDDFEAGETEFLNMQKRVKPKQGRVLIAPAHFPYVHRGNPPINGTKYVHTGWVYVN